jgi:UDP-N-acetylmuramate dehydrogenase
MLDKNIKIQTKIPLKGFSTFKIGGDASFFLEVDNKAQIKDVVSFATSNSLPIFILGGGSNILFDDAGYSGLVLKMNNKGVEIEVKDSFVYVKAEAGEEWDSFVEYCTANNFYGLENLSAIPGTIGASAVQNIGAYGVEAKDTIDSVEVFDIKTLEFKILKNEDCIFGYRESIFKTMEGKKYIVTSVTFKLFLTPSINISYKDLNNYFVNNQNPTPQEVCSAVISIRSAKFPDLKSYGTAGSFFKNIVCERRMLEEIIKSHPSLPVYEVGDGKVKTSTAFIIDKVCGLKGYREGDVGLYENQSIVVVNFANATSRDVKEFVNKIKNIAKERTGLSLEEEVVLA